jgi:nucleotide-binding universal stress UspA family protein
MLKKYQTRATESIISNIKILEAPGDDVAKELLNIADEQQIDTIVVGSRGLKAAKEFLLGSVSYKMTHYANLRSQKQSYVYFRITYEMNIEVNHLFS